jgi:hypothetical protein
MLWHENSRSDYLLTVVKLSKIDLKS